MSYATECDPHAARFAEQLVCGLDHNVKRALLTHLVGDGVLPTLALQAEFTAMQSMMVARVWDALVIDRPMHSPSAAMQGTASDYMGGLRAAAVGDPPNLTATEVCAQALAEAASVGG